LWVVAGYESIAFLLPPEDIRAHLRVRHREDEFRLRKSVDFLTPSPADAHRLYGWGRRLTDVAARQPELFDAPHVQSAAQVELFENLLMTLGSAVQSESSPHDLARQRHDRVVQIAEDYVLAHPVERVHVTDLCQAAGVSERTLQYAFKQIRCCI